MKHFALVLTVITSLSGAILISSEAMAGRKQSEEVRVSNGWADGNLAAARTSADPQQYIGCEVTNGSAICYALTSQGGGRSCSTSDPTMVATIRAMNGDSFLRFFFGTDGLCTSVTVSNISFYAPKSPT